MQRFLVSVHTKQSIHSAAGLVFSRLVHQGEKYKSRGLCKSVSAAEKPALLLQWSAPTMSPVARKDGVLPPLTIFLPK